MQILTIQTKFKAFECKLETFKRDSKHSNENSTDSKGIQSIQIQILTIRKGFETLEASKGIQMQILTIRTELDGFECQF